MDKYIARGLLPLVNTYNDLLCSYAESRIEILHGQLENTTDMNRILQLQGQIKELRRLTTLREEVIQSAKD